MTHSYDAACEVLAREFLSDLPDLESDANAESLAQAIQDAIEAWIEAV